LFWNECSGTPKEGWQAKLRREGVYFAGAGFTKESGEALLEQGGADAIVYGTKLLANPDLPERFRRNAPLNGPTSRRSMFRVSMVIRIIRCSKDLARPRSEARPALWKRIRNKTEDEVR
jgi:hypothetical protein